MVRESLLATLSMTPTLQLSKSSCWPSLPTELLKFPAMARSSFYKRTPQRRSSSRCLRQPSTSRPRLARSLQNQLAHTVHRRRLTFRSRRAAAPPFNSSVRGHDEAHKHGMLLCCPLWFRANCWAQRGLPALCSLGSTRPRWRLSLLVWLHHRPSLFCSQSYPRLCCRSCMAARGFLAWSSYWLSRQHGRVFVVPAPKRPSAHRWQFKGAPLHCGHAGRHRMRRWRRGRVGGSAVL